MKTLPGTRIIVVMAIGLVSGAAILVFAQPPTTTPKPEDLPFHLTVRCAHRKADSYNYALNYWKHRTNHRPDDYKILYDSGYPEEGSYPDSAPACGRPNSNVTQHLATNNSKDLVTFLKKLDK